MGRAAALSNRYQGYYRFWCGYERASASRCRGRPAGQGRAYRAFAESRALTSTLDDHVRAGSALVTSSLARVEVPRSVRAFSGAAEVVDELVEVALSGMLEKPSPRK